LRRAALRAGAFFVTVLAACTSLSRVGPAREATFTPAEPSVVAFTPAFDPLLDERTPDDYAAAISSLRTALGRLTNCAALPSGAVRLILADRIHVVQRGGKKTIEGSGAGVVVLMDTHRAPQPIGLSAEDGAGPGELQEAAAAYFDAPNCQPTPQPDP